MMEKVAEKATGNFVSKHAVPIMIVSLIGIAVIVFLLLTYKVSV